MSRTMRIVVENTERCFRVHLTRGKKEIAVAGYRGTFFLMKGKAYLLTGGDYYAPAAQAASLYELVKVDLEK